MLFLVDIKCNFEFYKQFYYLFTHIQNVHFFNTISTTLFQLTLLFESFSFFLFSFFLSPSTLLSIKSLLIIGSYFAANIHSLFSSSQKSCKNNRNP